MGRLIDVSELHNIVMLNKSDWGIFSTQIDRLIESLVMQVSTADAIPKSDYENRLKANMVAMLTEIKTEIKKVPKYCMTHDGTCVYRRAEEYISDINNLIQHEINALKSESEEV